MVVEGGVLWNLREDGKTKNRDEEMRDKMDFDAIIVCLPSSEGKRFLNNIYSN